MKMMEEGIEKYVTELRRYFHANPELSEYEYSTMKRICMEMDDIGIPYVKCVAGTGVCATLDGGTGPVVGIRADIDALPITEKNQCDYISQNVGVMHACGHDAHIAIALGIAKTLKKYQNELIVSVKFFFQPADETIGGAERMIKEGVLERPRVDYVLGLHVEPQYSAGTVGIRYGQMYAASDMIDIKVNGKGAHGAHPNEGIDAILIAAEILNAIQNIISREIDPRDAVVCSIGKIKGGEVRNQIAEHVQMEGIIRTLNNDIRIPVRNRVREVVEKTAKFYGGEAKMEVIPSYPALTNDYELTSIIEKTMAEFLGPEQVLLENTPDMSCEDFSFFAEECPSAYFHLGCRCQREEVVNELHNSRFDIDEKCLLKGVELQVRNILSIMEYYK